jgi:hypothetical protein
MRSVDAKEVWSKDPAPIAAGEARLFIESEEGLRWYVWGAIALLGFFAFILTGLFTTVRELPIVSVPFFGVFLWFGWKFAGKWLSGISAYVNFGTVRMGLERAPAPGGELRGFIEFEPGAAALANVDAELVCRREIPKAPNGSLPGVTTVVHSQKRVLAVHVEPGHRRAPFAFAIPADAPPSGEEEGSEDLDRPPDYIWKLNLKATHASGDLDRSFELDVRRADPIAQAPAAQGSSTAATVALVAANLLPLALVLAGHGSVGGLVALYWAENVVIGFYTVLRMLEAGRGTASDKAGKTLFFCMHYGMFCFVHGVFVTAMFLSREQHAAMRAPAQSFDPVTELWFGAKAMGLFSPGALLLPLLALVVSHGVSFYTNYMRNGRYLTARPDDSFWRPYPRMVLLHLCIIGGGFLIASRGSTVPLLAALVIGKTLIDLTLHRRSNR